MKSKNAKNKVNAMLLGLRAGVSESQLRRCYDCGKAYCPGCAERNPTIKELGACPDREEVFEGEEDYWRWE